MAEGKKAFVLYCDIIHTVEKLTKEQAGDLFKHILRYVNDQNPEPNDLITELTFEPIKQQLKRDLQRYKEKQAKRIEAGRLGGLKSGASRKEKNEANQANEANASICEPSETTDEQRSQSELKQSKRKQAETNEANASILKQTKQNEQVIDTVTVTVTGKDKDKDKERENINTHSPVRVSISELFDFLNGNEYWKEQVCMANCCKMEETEEAIAEFVARQKAENVEWKYTQDAYSHFSNWFRIQLEKKKKEKNERAKKNQLSAADKDEELLRHVAQGIERANAQRAAREQRG